MILYIDTDPFCCKWMENLIEAGQLPDGIVFQFDVREITPICLNEIDQAHFFAGIGGWAYALELAGWPRDWPVWTGSCPCQPWSVAGRGKGEDDERHLWPAWFRIIRECKPPIIFGEQVASPAARAWLDIVSADLESAGYAVGSANLCACGVGAPHLRQRLYWVAVSYQQRCEGSRLQLPARRSSETVDWVGNSANRQRRLREFYQSCEPTGAVGGRGVSDRLSDTTSSRFERRFTKANRKRQIQFDGRDLSDCTMWNPDEERIRRDGGTVFETEEKTQLRNEPYRIESPSPVSGFWRNAEWLYGRDGKFRPAEPSSFPLAPRLPRGMGRLRPWERQLADVAGADVRSLKAARRNRVGRLRGYGNSIVPHLAAEFIRAVMEIK
jgi:DNA (cytosine-5)-methyltransferase 1